MHQINCIDGSNWNKEHKLCSVVHLPAKDTIHLENIHSEIEKTESTFFQSIILKKKSILNSPEWTTVNTGIWKSINNKYAMPCLA